VAAPPTTAPKNPGQYVQVVCDDVYGDPGGTSPAKHNVKTGSQVPVEIAEVDRKIDDGQALRRLLPVLHLLGRDWSDETVSQTGNWLSPERN
jgi:hypothetical protein